MKKILFITHDTSRSGAPMVLLSFMKWLKVQQPDLKLGLVSLRTGELMKNFQSVSDYFYQTPKTSFYTKIRKRFTTLDSRYPTSFIRKILKEDYDLVYANTVSALPLGRALKAQKAEIKLVAHIHELTTTINMLQPNFVDYIGQVDLFIAVSRMVSESLKNDFSVSETKIALVYPFTEGLKPAIEKRNNNIFRVGASGTFHWRKGSDVFLQVVRYIHDNYSDYNIHFTWIGKLPDSERLIAEADIAKMGIQNKITFTGLVENPVVHFRELDVFLLPSREDPFPLVCIEVGMLGIPIICFEKAAGTAEILQRAGGFTVPYLNIEEMAQRIMNYRDNYNLRREHGTKNRELFKDFTVDSICPKLYSVLEIS